MCFYTSSVPDPGRCVVCGLEANEVVEDGMIVLYVCSCGETWPPPAIEETRSAFSFSFDLSALPEAPPPIPPVPPLCGPGKSDREQQLPASVEYDDDGTPVEYDEDGVPF